VTGIIVAGLADLKTELVTDKMLDPRIKAKVLRTVDISYGMERGLQEAIVQSEDILADASLTKERKHLQSFFNEVAQTDGNYATGTREVLLAFEQGAVDLLLCWEDLPTLRCTLRSKTKNDEVVTCFTPTRKNPHPSVTDLLAGKGVEDPTGYELKESVPLLEWLCDSYSRHGARLEFISKNSDQGVQFVDGFGGVGAVLRYHIDFSCFDEEPDAYASADGKSDDEDDFFIDEDSSSKEEAEDWDDFVVEPKPEKKKKKGKEKEKERLKEKEKEQEQETAPEMPTENEEKKTAAPTNGNAQAESSNKEHQDQAPSPIQPPAVLQIRGFKLDAPAFMPKRRNVASSAALAPQASAETPLLAN